MNIRCFVMIIESVTFRVFNLVPAAFSQRCDTFNNKWINTCPTNQPKEWWCYKSTNSKQKIEIKKTHFNMECDFQAPDQDVIPCSPIQVNISLTMVNCQFLNISLKNIVANKELITLVVEYNKNKQTRLDLLFNNLNKLSSILIKNVRTNESFPVTFGENTISLNVLEIDGHSFKKFEKSFATLTRLKNLKIRYGPIEVLKQETFYGLSGCLVSLDLTQNRINKIESGTFKNFTKLKTLYLTRNQLVEVTTEFFLNLNSLESLALDRNKLTNIQNKTFSGLKKLERLNISHNPLRFLPYDEPFGPSVKLKVSIKHCSLNKFPLVNWGINRYIDLDLSYNLITHPTLPACLTANVTVKLYGNNISNIILNTTCAAAAKIPKYFLANNKPECNCNIRPFIYYLHREQSKKSSTLFPDFYLLQCTENDTYCQDCPDLCFCTHPLANCSSNNLNDIPATIAKTITVVHLEDNKIKSLNDMDPKHWDHVIDLNLSHNLISSLKGWSIPKELKTLDVSYNRLYHIPHNLMTKVEKTSAFNIYLSNNEWRCDCRLVEFKIWFTKNKHRIQDYEDTWCHLRTQDGNVIMVLIKETSLDSFCGAIIVDSIITAVLLPIILVAILIYAYYYKYTLFALLYSWKLLRCSYFNKPVEEKKYDALVCSCVADRPIVIQLVRQLEPFHRLCIPERNWPKDAAFGTSYHVSESLKNSRGSLIVISENSLKELWFQVIFRGAYNLRLEDDIHKMILIVVGDISGVPVRSDLRDIIDTEPCLMWGERWFWQKLRFELRRPS